MVKPQSGAVLHIKVKDQLRVWRSQINPGLPGLQPMHDKGVWPRHVRVQQPERGQVIVVIIVVGAVDGDHLDTVGAIPGVCGRRFAPHAADAILAVQRHDLDIAPERPVVAVQNFDRQHSQAGLAAIADIVLNLHDGGRISRKGQPVLSQADMLHQRSLHIPAGRRQNDGLLLLRLHEMPFAVTRLVGHADDIPARRGKAGGADPD